MWSWWEAILQVEVRRELLEVMQGDSTSDEGKNEPGQLSLTRTRRKARDEEDGVIIEKSRPLPPPHGVPLR